MNKFHWFEAKQLDRVTNYSTEIEPLKYAIKHNLNAYYYCTFAKTKEYYGLLGKIIYLGFFKNKYLKAIEFPLRVILKTVEIILKERNSIVMVNQDLIKHTVFARLVNRIFKHNNKFITDIRTTPTDPERFDSDMSKFHSKFKTAIRHFDGFSFITPFMEKYIMGNYTLSHYKSVNWSSGVDVDLFNPQNCSVQEESDSLDLFYHGGISISRGNLDLIKAIQELRNEGCQINLLQVGICVDKEIIKYIKENKLETWCEILPPVPLTEIPQMIANCDLPVMPFPNFMAWRVSSPIKLMEYLAMGKRVLAPNMEAFSDVFGANSDLVYFYSSSSAAPIEELKRCINKIYEEGSLNRNSYFPEARNFVLQRYTWEKQAEKLFDFCKSL